MSSFYRQVNNNQGEESNYRVIDSNSLMEERIKEYMAKEAAKRSASNGEFVAGLGAERIEMDGEGYYEDGEEGYSDDMDALFADDSASAAAPSFPQSAELLEEAQEEAKRIVEAAQNQADMLLSNARSEVETLYRNTEKQARATGLEEGRKDAEAELNAALQELENDRLQLSQQLEIERAQMEAELVDVILDVFESVFLIEFSDKKELLLYMISNTLRGINGCHTFTIKVPPERMREMEMNKPFILDQLGSGVTMDVMADSSLHDFDCVIETENGIFECGPMLQLENLIRTMKALSLSK